MHYRPQPADQYRGYRPPTQGPGDLHPPDPSQNRRFWSSQEYAEPRRPQGHPSESFHHEDVAYNAIEREASMAQSSGVQPYPATQDIAAVGSHLDQGWMNGPQPFPNNLNEPFLDFGPEAVRGGIDHPFFQEVVKSTTPNLGRYSIEDSADKVPRHTGCGVPGPAYRSHNAHRLTRPTNNATVAGVGWNGVDAPETMGVLADWNVPGPSAGAGSNSNAAWPIEDILQPHSFDDNHGSGSGQVPAVRDSNGRWRAESFAGVNSLYVSLCVNPFNADKGTGHPGPWVRVSRHCLCQVRPLTLEPFSQIGHRALTLRFSIAPKAAPPSSRDDIDAGISEDT